MAWLSNWAKRIKVTVDNTNIDASLSHYPVPIKLGTSVGQSNDDVSAVFDEIGSSWQKLAITESDGSTQLYVEKELWNSTGESAVLWTSNSGWSLSTGTTTDFYIYYDSTKADNSSYVEAVGSRTEVWDSNFKMVLHMEGANATAIDDATSNNNDVTGDNDNPSYQQAGTLGYAVDFDGTNDYLTVADSASFTATDYTIEAFVKTDNTDYKGAIFVQYDATTRDGYFLVVHDTGSGVYRYDQYVGGTLDRIESDNAPSGSAEYLAAKRDSGDMELFVDATVQTDTETQAGEINSSATVHIGCTFDNSREFDGLIEEVRFSDTARSDAWIKATKHALNDNLLTYGAEEEYSGGFVGRVIIL